MMPARSSNVPPSAWPAPAVFSSATRSRARGPAPAPGPVRPRPTRARPARRQPGSPAAPVVSRREAIPELRPVTPQSEIPRVRPLGRGGLSDIDVNADDRRLRGRLGEDVAFGGDDPALSHEVISRVGTAIGRGDEATRHDGHE